MPLPIIDISSRLKHVIRVQNETLSGTSKAKPVGAIGCEIWRKIGDAPVGPEDMEYVDMTTHSSYIIEYAAEDGGKMAHYLLRWVGSGGEKSSWSETESATIAA